MGVRLLTRTTRSVAPTEAGARLVSSITPDIAHIQSELEALSSFRSKPKGIIRVSLGEHAARTANWPKLPAFLEEYPDVAVELGVDHELADIVADGFDAGVRLGERLAKEMVAVRIGPDLRMVVVGSAKYFEQRDKPLLPKDVTDHRCIGLRMRTSGGVMAWEFENGETTQNERVNGQLIVNSNIQVLTGALNGLGLGLIMEEVARPFITSGELVQVLDDWCPFFEGYHLYYPVRRQTSPEFAAFVRMLRYQPEEFR